MSRIKALDFKSRQLILGLMKLISVIVNTFNNGFRHHHSLNSHFFYWPYKFLCLRKTGSVESLTIFMKFPFTSNHQNSAKSVKCQTNNKFSQERYIIIIIINFSRNKQQFSPLLFPPPMWPTGCSTDSIQYLALPTTKIKRIQINN